MFYSETGKAHPPQLALPSAPGVWPGGQAIPCCQAAGSRHNFVEVVRGTMPLALGARGIVPLAPSGMTAVAAQTNCNIHVTKISTLLSFSAIVLLHTKRPSYVEVTVIEG
jgi:hypothetical protein